MWEFRLSLQKRTEGVGTLAISLDTVNVEIFAVFYFRDLVGQTFHVGVNFAVSGLQNYKFRDVTISRKYCSENKVIKIEFSFFVCLKINRRFPEGNQLSIIHVHVPVLM